MEDKFAPYLELLSKPDGTTATVDGVEYFKTSQVMKVPAGDWLENGGTSAPMVKTDDSE